jgi:hypothetical protein
LQPETARDVRAQEADVKDTTVSAVALVATGTGLALAPSPEVGFVLQGAGVGALAGTAIAQWRRDRGREVQTASIVARWTILGAGVALVAVLADAIARGVA